MTHTIQKQISLIEHLHRGRQLAAQHVEAVRMSVNLSRLYGRRHKATRAANEAAKALNDLRYELEALMFRDFHTLPNEAIQVYYPTEGHEPTSAESVEAVGEEIQGHLNHLENGDNMVELLDDVIPDLIDRYSVRDVRCGLVVFEGQYNIDSHLQKEQTR